MATLVDIDEVYDARGQVEFTLTDKKQSLGFKSNLKPNAQKAAFSSKGSIKDATANKLMNSGSKFTLTDMV